MFQPAARGPYAHLGSESGVFGVRENVFVSQGTNTEGFYVGSSARAPGVLERSDTVTGKMDAATEGTIAKRALMNFLYT